MQHYELYVPICFPGGFTAILAQWGLTVNLLGLLMIRHLALNWQQIFQTSKTGDVCTSASVSCCAEQCFFKPQNVGSTRTNPP